MNTQYCPQCGNSLIPQAQFCSACGAKINQRPALVKNEKQKNSMQNNSRVRRAFIALLAGGALLIVAAVFFTLSQKPIPTSSSTVVDSHPEEGIPYPEVPRLSLADAKARYEAGTAIFLDVRGQEDYEVAHIPNALSLPLSEIETRYQELPLEAEIIAYCT